MTQVRIGDEGGDVAAINGTTHVAVPIELSKGCTLAANTTYYFPVGDADSIMKSIQLIWDAAVVVTFTIQGTNAPLNTRGMGGGPLTTGLGSDTPHDDTGKGKWLLINPAGAAVYTASDDGSTGGATVIAATTVVAGGTAGGALYELPSTPTRRLRIRAVVGATGGIVRCLQSGKE